MGRYLITQSLISSWAYTFECFEGCEEDAKQDFLRVLRKDRGEETEAMRNGKEFEKEVYLEASGYPRKPHPNWEPGIRAVARIIQGAPIQVKCSRPLEVDGESFLVYGILDALKAGVIYDVKFRNKPFPNSENDSGVYGKYLNSAQHPFYFYIVPEAYEFQYLLSDGVELYVETYHREDVRSAASIISEFICSIRGMGLLDLYKEKWSAK